MRRPPVPPGRAGALAAGPGRLGQPHRADGGGAAGSGDRGQSGQRGHPTDDWLEGGAATGRWDGGDLGLVRRCFQKRLVSFFLLGEVEVPVLMDLCFLGKRLFMARGYHESASDELAKRW